MSNLKEFYVSKIRHDYDRIENSCWYLSELSLESAIEIDNYIVGDRKNKNFEYLEELREILEKYKLKCSDNVLTEPIFPFIPLFYAVKNHTLKCMACLVLEHAQNLFLLSHKLK